MDNISQASRSQQLIEPLIAGDNEAPSSSTNMDSRSSPDDAETEAPQPSAEEEIQQQESLHPSPSAHQPEEELAWYQCPLQLIAMLSNYSTSYNVVNISMVIPILEQIFKGSSSEDVAASASSLLAGMIVGQLVGGYLGDSPYLGRLGALQLVMALQVVASIGSSLLRTTHVRREHFYLSLAIFRFLLGVGAGGVYPLAAVLSAEQGRGDHSNKTTHPNHHSHDNNNNQQEDTEEEEDSAKQVRRVVLTFSTQGLGFITAPLVTVPLLYMTTNLDLVWRIILALGSVPGLILMIAQLWIHRRKNTNTHHTVPLNDETEVVQDATISDVGERSSGEDPEVSGQQQDGQVVNNDSDQLLLRDMQIMEEQLREGTSRWDAIKREPDLVQKLLGTAGTWFLFDVLFYGNTLFQPIVVDAAFGNKTDQAGGAIEEMRSTAIKSLLLASIALPGYAVAGLVMGKRVCCKLQTPKYVMLQGFAAMGTLYLAIGLNWSFLRHTPALLITLYGLTFFFANYGPNTTTFILPSLVFSPECRTTLNGIAAASGKFGALCGATLFEPAADSIGDGDVMLICAGVAVLSFLMTWKFVQMHSTTPNPV